MSLHAASLLGAAGRGRSGSARKCHQILSKILAAGVVEVGEVVTAMYGHLHHLAAVRYQHVMADRGAAIARAS